MYSPINLLPQNADRRNEEYQKRWKTKDGIIAKHRVFELLRGSATEHFLQKDFLDNNLKVIENEKDLKGIYLEDEQIKHFHPDTLKYVDLSYSYITHVRFENICFPNMLFHFSSFHKVTFIDCTFTFSTFYASKLKNVSFVNCDFLDKVEFSNCLFEQTRFTECFFEDNIFYDCSFDELTHIDPPISASRFSKKQSTLDRGELSEIYKGIKEGYLNGNVIDKKRDYYFLERQAITRYNLKRPLSKLGDYCLEIISGYGIRPVRVLISMISAFIIFTLIFVAKIGYPDGLLLSAGAYFTNGASSQFLVEMGAFYQFLYILESFLGILLIALFITVMANLWLTEK